MTRAAEMLGPTPPTSAGWTGQQHAEMHAHCRICAAACRRYEQACNALLASIG